MCGVCHLLQVGSLMGTWAKCGREGFAGCVNLKGYRAQVLWLQQEWAFL